MHMAERLVTAKGDKNGCGLKYHHTRLLIKRIILAQMCQKSKTLFHWFNLSRGTKESLIMRNVQSKVPKNKSTHLWQQIMQQY